MTAVQKRQSRGSLMIKILILTDDVYEWADKIVEELPNTQSIINTINQNTRIWNNIFSFEILSIVKPFYQERFNSVILDKFIDKNDFDSHISKLLLPDCNIYKTKRYKIWETLADIIGTEINSLLRLYPLDLLNIDNEKFEFKNKQSGEINGK